jgi:hypothetical protein
VVIAVEHDAVTVTYTDVHLARAKFFIGLFRNFAVEWSGLERKSAAGLGDDGAFYLVTGRFIYENAESREAFLENVGALLVFLIDWNKARKVLRGWISKNDAIRVLSWAAHHRIGHRAFLDSAAAILLPRRCITRHRPVSVLANAWTMCSGATPPSISSRQCCVFRGRPWPRAAPRDWRATASRRRWSRTCNGSTAP